MLVIRSASIADVADISQFSAIARIKVIITIIEKNLITLFYYVRCKRLIRVTMCAGV